MCNLRHFKKDFGSQLRSQTPYVWLKTFFVKVKTYLGRSVPTFSRICPKFVISRDTRLRTWIPTTACDRDTEILSITNFRKIFWIFIYFFSFAYNYEIIYVLRSKIEIIFYITSFSVQMFEVLQTRQIIIMTRKRVPSGNRQMFELVYG